MKAICSPQAFKSCYIAQVKEKMGFAVHKAHNRRGSRKTLVQPRMLPFIEEAIALLMQKDPTPTYKAIQQKAFELYQQSSAASQSAQLYGALRSSLPSAEIRALIEDDAGYYGLPG